ncbi:hypothetical protein BHE74_00045924 [Ensete ventricosum]|nr:hypothetical protein BHE74_00045924 [Ensete ventricosum]
MRNATSVIIGHRRFPWWTSLPSTSREMQYNGIIGLSIPKLDGRALDSLNERGVIGDAKAVKDVLVEATFAGEDDPNTNPGDANPASDLGLKGVPLEALDLTDAELLHPEMPEAHVHRRLPGVGVHLDALPMYPMVVIHPAMLRRSSTVSDDSKSISRMLLVDRMLLHRMLLLVPIEYDEKASPSPPPSPSLLPSVSDRSPYPSLEAELLNEIELRSTRASTTTSLAWVSSRLRNSSSNRAMAIWIAFSEEEDDLRGLPTMTGSLMERRSSSTERRYLSGMVPAIKKHPLVHGRRRGRVPPHDQLLRRLQVPLRRRSSRSVHGEAIGFHGLRFDWASCVLHGRVRRLLLLLLWSLS